MEEAGCQRLQKPGDHLERSEQSHSRALIVSGALQADRLVVEDLDPLVHGVVDEALQRAAVHLAEELAGVVRVLGEDDEGVVVEQVALDRLVLTGESFALLHLLLKHLLQAIIVDLGADHCGGSFDPVVLFEDGVSGGHLTMMMMMIMMMMVMRMMMVMIVMKMMISTLLMANRRRYSFIGKG